MISSKFCLHALRPTSITAFDTSFRDGIASSKFHSQNPQQWLSEWESFLVGAQWTGHIGLDAKVTGWEPIFCFIDAIRPIEAIFTEQGECDLQKNGKMTIHQVINEYRGHLQGTRGASSNSDWSSLSFCKQLSQLNRSNRNLMRHIQREDFTIMIGGGGGSKNNWNEQ